MPKGKKFGRYTIKKLGANDNYFQNPQTSKLSDDKKSRLPTILPDGRYVAYQSGDA